MDIRVLKTEGGAHIQPTSVHGMLWLQTHFENIHWDAIASNQIKLPKKDTDELSLDAEQAGLTLNIFPALTESKKF
tara:strand:+ start:339 stop:566 length:228 start_codon:yes stop_codon:yes gene_type:complete